MKKLIHTTFVLSISLFFLSGCLKDKCDGTRTFIRQIPVFVTPQDFRVPVTVADQQPLENPGKIYFYKNYIFINELREGIHIYDNANPENPNQVAFLSIPGNVDMAVRGNTLYADSYVDLLTIDIEDPLSASLIQREEEVFNALNFVQGRGYLVYYESMKETVDIDCSDPNFNTGIFTNDDMERFVNIDVAFDASVSGASAGGNAGTGGSLARFSIVDQYLYAIDQTALHIFNVSSPGRLDKENDFYVGWGIETLFPYDGNLFIGANDGMYIYDNSNPTAPEFLSKFQHARACDPVFVEGNTAYVTLRDGTTCQNFNNQLDVVDISNLSFPQLLETYPMHRPHGLSKAGDHLYICEDDEGLKVFDASSWEGIDERLAAHVKGFNAYDIITLPTANRAMVIGKDGFYQYDISNPNDLDLISVIPVERN